MYSITQTPSVNTPLRSKYQLSSATLTQLQDEGFHIDLRSVFLKKQNEIDDFIYNHKSNFVEMKILIKIWNDFKDDKADFILVNRIISYLYWEKSHT